MKEIWYNITYKPKPDALTGAERRLAMSKTSTKKTATSDRQSLQRYALKQATDSRNGWRVEARGDALILRR